MRFFGISNFGMANTEYFSPTLRWYPWTSQLLISGMMIFTIFQPTEIPAPFPPANQQTWPNIDVICGGGLRRTTCHMQNKTPTTQVDRFAIRISHLKHEISHFFFKVSPTVDSTTGYCTVWLTKIRLSSHPFNFWICVRSMLLRQILMLLVFVSSYWLVTWPNILELFLGENWDGSPKEFVGPVQNGPNPNTFCFFDHWVWLVGDKPSIVYWSNTDSLCLIHVFSARIKHWSISDI